MAGIVGTHLVAQVGFIVKDIEETKKKWAAFLGVDVPPTQPCGDYEDGVLGASLRGFPARRDDHSFRHEHGRTDAGQYRYVRSL